MHKLSQQGVSVVFTVRCTKMTKNRSSETCNPFDENEL
jgi:hypothetical protein